jgi:Skp family chaperone for outer membrane proteins
VLLGLTIVVVLVDVVVVIGLNSCLDDIKGISHTLQKKTEKWRGYENKREREREREKERKREREKERKRKQLNREAKIILPKISFWCE